MSNIMHRAIALAAVLPLVACGRLDARGAEGAHRSATHSYGAAVPVGAGTARAYVEYQDGRPIAVGVALDSAALDGLPAPRMTHGERMPGHEDMHEHLLALPADNPTPYRFVELDWNPGGHDPLTVYGKPHFDFHFYLVDQAQRDAIVPTDPRWSEKMRRFPAAEFLLDGYTPAGEPMGAPVEAATVPRMGVHWTSINAPELQPVGAAPFTHTYIVGTWDGRVIFHEPMITHETLRSRATVVQEVPVAKRHLRRGLYPDRYTISYDAVTGTHHVRLAGLRER